MSGEVSRKHPSVCCQLSWMREGQTPHGPNDRGVLCSRHPLSPWENANTLIDWLIDWLICSLQVLYHLSNVSSLFGCRYFSNRVSCFCPGWPGPSSSYLCFPCSWDDRHTMPSFYKLRWGLWNFLQGLSYCLINFTDFLDWILVALGPNKLKGIFLYAVLFPKYFQSILLKVIIDSKNSYISHINPMSVFLF
jgi:hypothetical protein